LLRSSTAKKGSKKAVALQKIAKIYFQKLKNKNSLGLEQFVFINVSENKFLNTIFYKANYNHDSTKLKTLIP